LLYTAVNFLNAYLGDTLACITIAFYVIVFEYEVNAMVHACTALNPEYTPIVTFLVVQKRHHTRFFPTRKEDEDGKNHNVPPGTVVDSKITHPIELDFFLVSHASIQV
jgi:eukaryotic translation initiation factor 2C